MGPGSSLRCAEKGQEAPSGRAGDPRGRAATVYCMNEAELVDVALGTLAEKLQREEAEEKAWYGSEEEQELPPTLSTPAGSAGSAEEGSDCNPGLPSPLGAGAEKTGGEDSGDDVLKYVREIFFS
ncbi:cell cycle regulator of non-homologous end joining [Apteryx rowi]|uniref:cell cycle regulator of non-homologous end joining n=1 Tax=Apteryx rowi TaxID=308060 RepID=UPI000E1D243D|nr:cell cycle regulator of non-homologous end joining [Apteryx rowi]